MQMGAKGSYKPRSYHAEILNKDRERLHYHLVYLTRHQKGLIKFAEASQKADYLQLVVRHQARIDASRQNSLFSAETSADTQFNAPHDLESIKAYWLRRLSSAPTVVDEAFIADMLENSGWPLRDIENAVAELIKDGEIENLDTDRRRTLHPVHYWKRERLIRTDGSRRGDSRTE